jgi:hypothetical protein
MLSLPNKTSSNTITHIQLLSTLFTTVVEVLIAIFVVFKPTNIKDKDKEDVEETVQNIETKIEKICPMPLLVIVILISNIIFSGFLCILTLIEIYSTSVFNNFFVTVIVAINFVLTILMVLCLAYFAYTKKVTDSNRIIDVCICVMIAALFFTLFNSITFFFPWNFGWLAAIIMLPIFFGVWSNEHIKYRKAMIVILTISIIIMLLISYVNINPVYWFI